MPQVLLSGRAPGKMLAAAEAERMVALLLTLKTEHAIAGRARYGRGFYPGRPPLTVMVNGQVIASGLPSQVRASEQVQIAYLGH